VESSPYFEKTNTRCCYDGPCNEAGWADNHKGNVQVCGGSKENGLECSGLVRH
jgi:hypothetical protein